MSIKDIPSDWSLMPLRSISSLNPTRKDWPSDPLVSFFEMSQVSAEGRMSNGASGNMSDFSSGFTPFKEGDVILAKITPCFENGKGAFVENMPSRYGLGSTEFHVVRAGADLDARFFFYLSTSYWFRKNGERNMTGSAGQRRVPTDWLKALKIPLPPLPEQKKIAEILGACDEAIEAQERLIAQKQQRKKGLMQKLLTGEVRFPEFEGSAWQKVKAAELFTTRSEKNKNGLPVLSVTQDQGILLRSELERRISSASENHPNYKVVFSGDFVISLRSFQGGLEYSRIRGAVSPAYHVIHKKREICEEFYRYFFKSWEFIGRLTIATIGIRDGKQIAFRDFSFMELPEPSLKEQKAISSTLCAQDEEIALQQSKLEQLKQQKKGLMQQLLTGKVRVKV